MSGSTTIVNQGPKISALFEAYNRLADPSVADFTSSIPENFRELVSRATSNSVAINDFILRNRTMLKSVGEKFHREAGTLTQSVHESIQLLDDPTTRIVVSTHQPNLFAYSGVFKKIVLLEKLQNASADLRSDKVVNIFLVVDHDFLDETWIRSAQMPSMNHSGGIMELRVPVGDSKRWQLVCNTPLPSKSIVNNWKHQVKSWIRSCTESRTTRREDANSNFDEFWHEVVEASYSRANSYSDLNAFIMSTLVNRVWGYGTLFVRLSQMSHIFENGFTFLLSNFGMYSEALRGIETRLLSKGIDTGVGASSYKSAPVWLHCMCGSKASAKVVLRDRFVWLEGPCMSCKKNLETNLGRQDDLDLSRIVNHLSPRAIPIPLLLSRDLGVNCYASGTGGIGYLVDGSIVAKKLGLKFPLVTVWASKDRYVGIGQLPVLSESETRRDFEAELASLRKLSEICHAKIVPLLASRDISMKDGCAAAKLLAELFSLKEEQRKIRQQISAVVKSQNIARLAPCFIDYAVNFGIKATEDSWANHLQNDGRLATPVEFPNRQ